MRNASPGLKRSRENRMVAGVCGGIAEWLDWSPTLVRILFGPGKPKIDGQTASLLLRPPVGISAGKPLDETGLAMVDVTGSADQRHCMMVSISF